MSGSADGTKINRGQVGTAAAGSSSSSSEDQQPKSFTLANASRPGVWDGLASLSPSRQLKRFTGGKIACERESLLLGMGTGAGVLSVGLIAQRGFRKSGNWGALAFVTVTLASFTMCRSAKREEARKMRLIMEDFRRKREVGGGADLAR